MTDSIRQQLVQSAVDVRARAYAPYSNFAVGAALLTKSQEIITGTNVENASYGLTNCAERTAVFTAVASGLTEFEAIAISVEAGGAPCGACRQVLNEFAPDLLVLMADARGEVVREMPLSELLPHSFGPENLKNS